MTHAIGIDIGGSKIAACLVDVDHGEVVDAVRAATRPERGGDVVLADCVDMARTLRAGTAVGNGQVPIGVGICELVSTDGDITSSVTIDWRGADLAGAFGSRVLVESDVRAAAIGEARLGAGRGCPCFVYVTVGTGVAFTLVIDGTPYVGARGNALILGAPPVEFTASGAALARLAGTSTAEEVFDLAEAAELVRQGAHDLGRALAWLVNALDPELVVIGGGLGLRDDYRDAAVAEMRGAIEVPGSRDVLAVPAELGADAGALGAALLASQRSART